MTAGSWGSGLRAIDIRDLAQRLGGFKVGGRRGAAGWISPCPACGAPTRHTKSGDRRGAVGVTPDGRGWHCFQCEAKGGAVTFLSLHLHGAPYRGLHPDAQRDVRRWCVEEWPALLAAPPEPGAASRTEAAAPADERSKEPPPEEDVRALWDACLPLASDPGLVRWLERERRLPAGPIEAEDLARALPREAPSFPWARFGKRSWREAGHRFVVPLFDAKGALRSLLVRFIGTPSFGPKSLSPRGCSRRGLIMADARARALREPGPIVIAEGEMDFLAWATVGQEEPKHATLGIFAGSWRDKRHAGRIPNGSKVLIATDRDDAGEVYTNEIYRSLRRRDRSGKLEVTRWDLTVTA